MIEPILWAGMALCMAVISVTLSVVLRRLRDENHDLYEEVMDGAEISWLDRFGHRRSLLDLPVIANLFKVIFSRRDKKIISGWIWTLFVTANVVLVISLAGWMLM